MTRALIAACLAVMSVASPGRAHDTFFECLSQFSFAGTLGVGGLCQAGPPCRFDVRVCFNEPVPPEETCTPGSIVRTTVKARGNCQRESIAELRRAADPLGTGCGPAVPLFQLSNGRCVIHLKSRTAEGRKDIKRLYLDCPPPGGKCGCVPGPGRPCPHP